MLARIVSLVFMAGAAVLFFAFLGVAIYIGAIVFLLILLYVFFTAGAEKSGKWWDENSYKFRFWKQRMFGRFRSFFSSEPEKVHDVKVSEVEILSLEDNDLGKVVWKNESGLPLTIIYNEKNGSMLQCEIWLLKICRGKGGVIKFFAIGADDNQKCVMAASEVLKVYTANGEGVEVGDFLRGLGVA